MMADITVTDFRDRFPEFAAPKSSDAQVVFAIEEAYALTDVVRLATLYAVAHLLSLAQDIAASRQRPGEVEEVKVGPITTKHKAQAMTERQVFFSRTEYGRRVLALESRNVTAVVSVRNG